MLQFCATILERLRVIGTIGPELVSAADLVAVQQANRHLPQPPIAASVAALAVRVRTMLCGTVVDILPQFTVRL